MGDPLFARHLRGSFVGDYPDARLAPELGEPIGTNARIVRLSEQTSLKQAKHGLVPEDYRLVQRMINRAEMIQESPSTLALQLRDGGRWWRAILKATLTAESCS